MRGFGVEVVVEPALVGRVEWSGVGYGEVGTTLPTGNEIGLQRGQVLLPRPARINLALLRFHSLCIAQGLEALETFVWLYALYVVVPLPTGDRLASVKEPAGTKHRVEVGSGPAFDSLLDGLGCIVEAGAGLRLHVLANVVVGEGRKEERDEKHSISYSRVAQVLPEAVQS